jgi:hypothetical protein
MTLDPKLRGENNHTNINPGSVPVALAHPTLPTFIVSLAGDSLHGVAHRVQVQRSQKAEADRCAQIYEPYIPPRHRVPL